MPFALIPAVLGVCFFLIWAFIGGMILRDGQLAAQRERESNSMLLPLVRQSLGRSVGRGPTKRLTPRFSARAAS